jgi:hypothetical protein
VRSFPYGGKEPVAITDRCFKVKAILAHVQRIVLRAPKWTFGVEDGHAVHDPRVIAGYLGGKVEPS